MGGGGELSNFSENQTQISINKIIYFTCNFIGITRHQIFLCEAGRVAVMINFNQLCEHSF